MFISEYQDYRDFLKDLLESRIQKNYKYSLRAFARDLDIAPQVLSAVFNRKKGISTARAVKLASKLGLSEQETSYLCDLVDLAHARSTASQKVAAIRLARYKNTLRFETLKMDTLHVISDWYHFAILELTYVEGFKSDISWIARKLKISNHEASQAVERLLRLNLLSKQKGVLKKTDAHLTTSHDIPSEAIRNFNRQILQKANDALTFQELADRDLTTMTMAIDVKKIPEAKNKIRSFRRELTDFLETGVREEVYCLSVQLFRLSEKNQGKK